MLILAGDIGGTKTHLALYTLEGKMVVDQKFPSKSYSSLVDIIKKFRATNTDPISKACFGIAGPIVEGRAETPNLAWVVELKELQHELGIDAVWMINDLVANAHGLDFLEPSAFGVLNTGNVLKGHAALLSAGTGLGQAGLYWDGQKHRPFSSEGGHANFAPRDELEMELLRYLKKNITPHVSCERVLSGSGIYRLYRFLTDNRLETPDDDVSKALADKSDPAIVITDKGLNKSSPICQRVLDWFVSLYGSEAGNVALRYLAVGGVFIGGGIAPKILPALQTGAFMDAFTNKGRLSHLLVTIPVKVVLEPKTALLGAAQFALEQQ